jgi:hypothetical protein
VSAVPTPSQPATIPGGRSAGQVRLIEHQARRSHVALAGSLVLAWVLILAVALLGIVNASGRSHDAGVSLAAGVVSGGESATDPSVIVRNGGVAPFTGDLVLRAGKRSHATPLRLQPGESRTVAVPATLGARCAGVIDVRLRAPDAPTESIQLPCPRRPRS